MLGLLDFDTSNREDPEDDWGEYEMSDDEELFAD